jgi:phospholipid/cholesterol/gamma-HCH transport system substrate-binding protein
VNPALIGTMMIVVALALIWFAYEVANGIPGVPYHVVDARFTNVAGLRVGDDVRVDSVRIGQVQSIGYRDGAALVALQLPPGYKVYKDASATIGARNDLGTDFLELSPGTPSAGLLTSNVIPTTRTKAIVVLSQLQDIFTPQVRSALGQLVRTVGAGTAGQGPNLGAFLQSAPANLADLATISKVLAAPSTGLPGLLAAGATLGRRFDGTQAQLAALVQDLGTTLRSLDTDSGQPLSQLLQAAPGALRAARPALMQLSDVAQTTTAAVTDLRPGLAALGRATPDLRSVLRNAVSPLDRLPSVAGQAVPAVSSLTSTSNRLQPVAPLIDQAIVRAAVPVAYLAPYAPAVSQWFTYARSATNEGDANGHWLRFIPVVGVDTVAGVVPLTDPLTCRDPFPAPGQVAAQHGNLALLGGCK